MAFQIVGSAKTLDNAIGDDAALIAFKTGEQYGEFVAAEPRHRVRLPYAILQAFSHGFQEFVSRRMTERVVHRLEVIEIEAEKGNRLTPSRARKRLVQLLAKQPSVRQIRQSVLRAQAAESLPPRASAR